MTLTIFRFSNSIAMNPCQTLVKAIYPGIFAKRNNDIPVKVCYAVFIIFLNHLYASVCFL